MQAFILLVVYALTTITFQFCGFLISQAVNYQFPGFSLMSFLILFLAAFGLAWPVAVMIAQAIIKKAGMVLETQDTRAI